MKPTIELLFFEQFILLKSMQMRAKSKLATIRCVGVEDGEALELYINGKKSKTYIVRNGEIVIPIEKNKQYRIASQKHPYGFKFSTTPANDDTEDTLLFQSFHAEAAEMKNIYRILEVLCSKITEQEKQIAELSGYQTE